MKKKILLISLLAAIFCLVLSVSIFAENRTSIEYTDASGQSHQVKIVRFENDTPENVASTLGNNATMQAKFKDDGAYVILKATDGSLCAYPTWYIIEPSGNSISYVAISETEYGYVNANNPDGKTYARGAILYIEYPYGMTHLRNNGVFGRGTHYECNVTEMVVPSTVVEIQSMAFSENKTLKKVHIGSDNIIATIGDDAFLNCVNLELFAFEKLTHLEYIDGFNNCALLTGTLDLSHSTKLTKIDNNCFNGCKFSLALLPDSLKHLGNGVFKNNGLTWFKFPASLEYIGDDSLSGNPNMVLESGILPKNLNYVGMNFLYGCKNLPETIVFPEGVTTIPDEGFPEVTRPNGQGKLNIVFLGKMTKVIIDGSPYNNWAEQVTVYFAQNTISDFSGKVYSYTDKGTGELGSCTSQSGTLVLDVSDRSVSSTKQVGANFLQLVFCGDAGKVQQSYVLTTNGDSITEDRGMFDFSGHTCQIYYINNEDCTASRTCFVCDVNFANTEHSYSMAILYTQGFMNAGIKAQACTNAGCLVADDGVDVAPIFECLGLSMSEFADANGNYSITQGFRINREAYNAYIEAGYVLSFGIVVGVENVVGSEPLTVENGEAVAVNKEKTIFAPQNLISHDYVDVKLAGISKDRNGIGVIMCMYACDAQSVYYISESAQSDIAQAIVINI